MIAAFDVHYLDAAEDPVAVAAAVVFADWRDPEAAATYLARVPSPAEYEPGQFFKRELPALRAVIDLVKEPIDTYVVDGYCTLSADGAPGSGVVSARSDACGFGWGIAGGRGGEKPVSGHDARGGGAAGEKYAAVVRDGVRRGEERGRRLGEGDARGAPGTDVAQSGGWFVSSG